LWVFVLCFLLCDFTDFERVLRMFGGNRRARLSMGSCQLKLGHLKEAEHAFNQVERDPKADRDNRGLANFNLGVIAETKAKEAKNQSHNQTADRTAIDHYKTAIDYYQRAEPLLDDKEKNTCQTKIIKRKHPRKRRKRHTPTQATHTHTHTHSITHSSSQASHATFALCVFLYDDQ
jgi:hypothetical protein